MRRLVLIAIVAQAFASVTLVTDHCGNDRSGTNAAEAKLSPTFVASGSFGKICDYKVDGDVYAQPLYLSGVTGITGTAGATDILVVATMHNSLYLFDASNCGPPIWRTNFGANQAANSFPGISGALWYNRELGCRGTPAIDPVGKFIYSVCSTATTWVLRKTDLTNGTTSASVTVTATVSGVTFCPLCQDALSGMTLANGNVYATFSSMLDQTDHGEWYGWVMGYAQSDLSSVGTFCTTCAGGNGQGGIWQDGGGPSVDGSGNLYVVTGNGVGTPAAGNLNEAVVKLSSTLSLVDWYAPSNYATLNTNDWDMSTGRAILVPGTNVLVFGAKDFNVYSLNTGCLGNLGGTNNGCTAPQVFVTGSTGSPSQHQGIYGGVFVPGLHKGFFPNTAGAVYGFSISGSTWNTTPAATSANTYEFPGAQLSASCFADNTNCIVWGTVPVSGSAFQSMQPSKLVAFNPSDLSEYWSSTGKTADAVGGSLSKLTTPTIANGRVYVGTVGSNETVGATVSMYGDLRFRHILIG